MKALGRKLPRCRKSESDPRSTPSAEILSLGKCDGSGAQARPAFDRRLQAPCRAAGVACMYILMYINVMSHRYSIAEARSSLSTIIDQAEAGLEIELTRRGKPVAVVVSFLKFERLRADRPRFGDVYRSFLKKHSLDQVGLEDDFAASAREKGVGREVSL